MTEDGKKLIVLGVTGGIAAYKAADEAIDGRLDVVEAALGEGEGSVADQIADAKAAADALLAEWKAGEASEESFAALATTNTDDTGSIVAVTYGGKGGNDNEAFKTFILNYNSFSVEVVFEGTTYTIPEFGLVVIYR